MLVNVERGKLIIDPEDIFRVRIYNNETLTDNWKTVYINIRSMRRLEEVEIQIDEDKLRGLMREVEELLKL